MNSVWKFLTSLRLTVVCLSLSVLLVFFGTLAQVHDGLWLTQERWFKSLIVFWGPQGATWRIPIFPGGYLIGGVLLVNLLASHVRRFQWGWHKLGIHLTHAGIVLLLVGHFATEQLSRESLMTLREGESKVYSESPRENELIFARDAGEKGEEVVSIPGAVVAQRKEIKHPQLPFTITVSRYQPNSDIVTRQAVTDASATLTTALATMEAQYALPEGLPVQAQRALESEGREQVWRAALKAVGENSKGDLVEVAKKVAAQPAQAAKLSEELKTRFRQTMLQRFVDMPQRGGPPSDTTLAQARLAERLLAKQSIAPEAFPVLADDPAAKGSAVFDLPASAEMDKRNIPYAVVLLMAEGKSLGSWLVSPTLRPVEITAGGKTYRMAFRFERYYQPFSLTLLKTTHEVYPGTATASNPQGIPKNFQSRVLISNPGKEEKREVDIFMNNPLTYGGLKYFQYQMGSAEAASGAQIGTSTFQVVKNPSWQIPYLACLVVGAGMLYQFLFHLFKFINKRASRGKSPAPAEKRSRTHPEPAGAIR